MREIKFRGKSLNTGEWVYGGIEYQIKIGKVYIAQDFGGISCVEVDPATVGQYTGLKDRNGIEIYEGDIVRFKLGTEKCIGIVFYDDQSARYAKTIISSYGKENKDLSSYISSQVVIGNVDQNPELLKRFA